MASSRPTHSRFGLANLTYLWRRAKEGFGTFVFGHPREEGVIQRPGFEAQQAHMVFLDLVENRLPHHSEEMKERLRKRNLKSILQSDFGRA